MRKMEELPKTAEIKGGRLCRLYVENHRVTNDQILFEWLLGVMNSKQWKAVLAQLISQGFHIGAVIDECIKDIKDPNNLLDILFTMSNYWTTPRLMKKSITLKHDKKILAEVEAKLKSCRDWKDFYREFKEDGDFRVHLRASGGLQII